MKKTHLLLLSLFQYSLVMGQTTPTLVADINTGSNGSGAQGLTVLGSTLYLRASTNPTYLEIMKYTPSAGASSATSATDDLYVPSIPTPIAVANGTVYFEYVNASSDVARLYYLNSSGAAVPVSSGSADVQPNTSRMIAYSDKLFFDANYNGDETLCYVDAANTVHVAASLAPLSLLSINEFAIFDNKVYYTALHTSGNSLLYAYDPVTSANVLVSAVSPSATGFDRCPQNLFAGDDNKLYFSMATTTDGRELYSYSNSGVLTKLTSLNGSSDGVNGGYSANAYHNLIKYGNAIYFAGCDGLHGYDLMKYDIASNTTVLVSDINPSAASSDITNLFEYGGKLYFDASNGANGRELWMTDGTTANTAMVADINLGTADSDPGSFCAYNGKLFFSATDALAGLELFSFAPATGIQRVESLVNNTVVFPNPAGNATTLTVNLKSPSDLIIVLSDINGQELYKTQPKNYPAGQSSVVLNLGEYPSGNYQYSILSLTNGLMAAGKIAHQ